MYNFVSVVRLVMSIVLLCQGTENFPVPRKGYSSCSEILKECKSLTISKSVYTVKVIFEKRVLTAKDLEIHLRNIKFDRFLVDL